MDGTRVFRPAAMDRLESRLQPVSSASRRDSNPANPGGPYTSEDRSFLATGNEQLLCYHGPRPGVPPGRGRVEPNSSVAAMSQAMWFEDLPLGLTIRSGELEVDEARLKSFAA